MNTDKTNAVTFAVLLVAAVSCGRRLEKVSCRVFPDGEATVCELASDG